MTNEEQNQVLAEAKDHQVQGKRCLAIGDYQTAVDYLEQACRLFDSVYGVGKRDCADAYLDYGTALVALGNSEADILNNVGGDENDDDDDDEAENGEEEEKENDDQETDQKKPEPQAASTSDNQQSTSSSNQKLCTKSNGVSSKATEAKEEPVAGTSSGLTAVAEDEDTEEDEEKEASTMEIAWEVLCLAKRVFMTDESLESQLKLAETLSKLGEISIEWDNNNNAVSILEECLKIRNAILKDNDRLISATYYNLGLAHSFMGSIPKANECFTNSIKTIEKRIEFLQTQLKLADENQDVIAKTEYEKELQQLKELLPEILMRIDEANEEENAVSGEQAIKRSREETAEEEAQLKRVCADQSKPVADISHLLKRRSQR